MGREYNKHMELEDNFKSHHPREVSRKIIQSLKVRADAKRTASEKFADWMTGWFGSLGFLILNLVLFLFWLLINTGLIGGIKPFDPFPFTFLTLVVSLEAIILAITVLISQNREMKIGDLRDEIDLQVDMIAERELTKLMRVVAMIAEKSGINISKDIELQEMLRPTDTGKIQRALEKQIQD